MFSKSQIKLIKSLSQKKFRNKHRLFLIEGKKGIFELLDSSLELHSLYTVEDIFNASEEKINLISEADLKKISNLHTPQTALAIFHMPEVTQPEVKGLQVVLDEVQDPGNLGTIIRLCDWFGVEDLICSLGTVDCYNPKVVQATMGSISRVKIHYLDITEYLALAKEKTSVYGTFLEGENVYTQPLSPEGIIVLGNEANGISSQVEQLISKKLLIPQFGNSHKTESLNVATAAAIFLSEFSRRKITGK
ncbi:TrmH family RNA methyltransferase [Salinimicrobium sediminilitoris]|uniref:TrmH family RNA methyltransferase n=1 Tax=Salinimicrobium sediminilitoris TaxID=2876715 RepID=UPI001E4EAD3C|nr:RNA methyltransferase [Salinimicrobium sediminilitoris]MCC8358274.1 RNA methyltransferase [Salinimicrobium sediminilitoris]